MLAGLDLPVLLLPGNHDLRENLIAGLELGAHAVTDGVSCSSLPISARCG